ncbi:hypothetical protein FJY69_06725 [candidate division WOR-3 bacterium]|nr:hypothetical protein [candidate division WOR-3 bacterium]
MTSTTEATVILAVILIVVIVLAVGLILRASGRRLRRQFESRVVEARKSGCTCDYAIYEEAMTTRVTRRHDCPVHGQRGPHA